ncbi:MAG: hypothetical protein KAW92_10425 [Candidatus Cloacimonetes bacterium]|nr:hypothetical protein [Candidatus Cloacimonadota bacterium]
MLKCNHCGKNVLKLFRVCGTCCLGALTLVSFKCIKENHPLSSICKECVEKQGGLKG